MAGAAAGPSPGDLRGAAGNDIVGLQTDRYATNFLDSVEAFVRDARVDRDGRHVRWRGRTIWVRDYPISIDPDGAGSLRAAPKASTDAARRGCEARSSGPASRG